MPAAALRSGTASPTDASSPPCRTPDSPAARTADVSHTRPFSSSIGLWTLFLLVQIDFLAPVRRRRRHLRRGRRRVRIAHRQRDLADRVRHRIEHRQVVGAQLERAVEQAVGVDASDCGDRSTPRRADTPSDRPSPTCVMTTLRSTPCGRGGAGGTSPRLMRSVQSANSSSARSLPRLLRPLIMLPPACPDCMPALPRVRRATGTCRAPSGISRVALCAELMTRRAAAGLHAAHPLAPGSSCSARCRCPVGRCRGTRSCRERAAARASSRPGSTAPPRARSARSTAVRFSALPGVARRPSANRPGRSRAPTRCSSPSADREADSGPDRR